MRAKETMRDVQQWRDNKSLRLSLTSADLAAVGNKEQQSNAAIRELHAMRCAALQELGSSISLPILPLQLHKQRKDNLVDPSHPILAPYNRQTLSIVPPVTFGHRPRSASRMVFNPMDSEAEARGGHRAKKAGRRRAGMSAAVLQQLLHFEEPSSSRQAPSGSSNAGNAIVGCVKLLIRSTD
jgi:hypothetical protein